MSMLCRGSRLMKEYKLNKSMGFESGLNAHEHRIAYARDLSYYTLKEMENCVHNAHKLFERKLDMFDSMYYLKIITYGELQRTYKRGI